VEPPQPQYALPPRRSADRLSQRFFRVTIPILLISATVASSVRFWVVRFPACGSATGKSSRFTISKA
jgi:hypothetical protein